jgi:hypothetical protein
MAPAIVARRYGWRSAQDVGAVRNRQTGGRSDLPEYDVNAAAHEELVSPSQTL